ncbi:MAG: hypothetical protein SEPTF4163_004332 [Sporothrix epigloea]
MRLAPYEFEIKHRPGTSSSADGPSRRPDCANGFEVEDLLPDLKRKAGAMQATMAWNLQSLRPLVSSARLQTGASFDSVVATIFTSPAGPRVTAADDSRSNSSQGLECSCPWTQGCNRYKRRWSSMTKQVLPAVVAIAVARASF